MTTKRLLVAVVMLTGLLLGDQDGANEELRVSDNLRHEYVLLPNSVPDKAGFVVIDYVMLLDEEGATAILACYDDLKTNLDVDYVELYDLSGNLLLVNWIDRYGIGRFAMDRGLFNEHPVVDRVLVLITNGTEV